MEASAGPVGATASAAAEVAREVNGHIRATAESLAANDEDRDEYRFFCECGCLEGVTMTRAEYGAAGGAWLDGHEPDWRR